MFIKWQFFQTAWIMRSWNYSAFELLELPNLGSVILECFPNSKSFYLWKVFLTPQFSPKRGLQCKKICVLRFIEYFTDKQFEKVNRVSKRIMELLIFELASENIIAKAFQRLHLDLIPFHAYFLIENEEKIWAKMIMDKVFQYWITIHSKSSTEQWY